MAEESIMDEVEAAEASNTETAIDAWEPKEAKVLEVGNSDLPNLAGFVWLDELMQKAKKEKRELLKLIDDKGVDRIIGRRMTFVKIDDLQGEISEAAARCADYSNLVPMLFGGLLREQGVAVSSCARVNIQGNIFLRPTA